ncbi:MAG: ABC transporter ATP-binding protein, partial [Myxococcota bacterium]
NRLPRVDFERNEKAYTPELVNRFFDVVSLQKSASSLLLSFLEIALQTIIGMVVLGFYHPYLLAYDVALLVGLLFVVFVLGRGALETSFHESTTKYAMAAWLEDLARHPMSFKSRRGMDLAAERANRLANDYLEAREHHWRVVLRQIIGFVAIQAFASAALLGIGGYLVIQGELTLGQLVAAELIVTTVTTSVAKFGKYFETYYDAVTSVYKIGNLLDLPLEPYEGELPESREGALKVEFDKVCLSHGSGVVKSLSMTIEPSTRVGLRGEGAARSVLIDSLFGLFQPSSGAIMLDGTPIKELSSPMMRDDISLVRTVDVFDGTIDENLRLGQELLDPNDVRDALERVDLLEEFERLEHGIATRLMAHGAPLSQDQLIRLMIARAILGKPRLVLIDGALDGVRPDRLDKVVDALCGSNGWTSIVASNRPEVLAKCDRVFELTQDGLTEVKP